jgi:uncharacterized OsmC-like protein
MTNTRISDAIESLIGHLTAHPDKCRTAEQGATAILDEGLRCRVNASDGTTIGTDMPVGIGGSGKAPPPGWFFRAAIAACNATVIAMRAARLGITLNKLEVTVDSESDRRGLLGMDDVVPGPLRMSVRVNLGAEGIESERLREIVSWAHNHSPMADAIRRAVETEVDIRVV